MSTPADTLFVLRLSCCGRDDGYMVFTSWEEADAFRESYTSGSGVAEHGYSAPAWEPGHRRAGIIETVSLAASVGSGGTPQ